MKKFNEKEEMKTILKNGLKYINAQFNKLDVNHKAILNDWDEAFEHDKRAYRAIVKAHNMIGQKTFYYMILKMQKALGEKGAYTLKK